MRALRDDARGPVEAAVLDMDALPLLHRHRCLRSTGSTEGAQPEGGSVTRNPHRLVQLEIAFLAFLSLTIWAIRELRGIL